MINLIHSDKDAKKQIDAIQSAFMEYQLALYTHSFSSFLDVMLVGNYASEYLSGIKQKIESYSWQYSRKLRRGIPCTDRERHSSFSAS